MANGYFKNISFKKRDIAIPADYRPMYKIGHIVLILYLACRSNKASLMKLHFLCWAIKSNANLLQVKQWMLNGFRSDYHIWGIEPTVNRTLIFAVAERFITLSDGGYTLTENGIKLYKLITKEQELFKEEKEFLEGVGKNGISEQRIKDLSSKFL